MLILPAIDLRGGKCVRLKQGDYSRETVFGDDPVAMARRWVSEGARALHLVDLDGAKEGKPVNGPVIRRIVESIDVPCQVGGGLRTEGAIEATLDWLETSEASALDMAREFANWPLYAIVYTDIARDGMLGGPDVDGLAEL